jgi:hypothetical protein
MTDGEKKRPVVVLGIPCGPSVSFGFLQAILRALCDPEIDWRPMPVGNTVVHLARDMLIRAALQVPDVTHLVMVDSDQVWHHGTIRRLVEWDVPVVAPVVVQRNGEAIPVAYREVTQDERGYWRYDPLLQEIAIYLRRYNPERWQASGAAVGLLPTAPDYADPNVNGLPDELRAGLAHPLFPVDALGTGMICFRRDVLEAMQPDPKTGLYCDFQQGGEDFSLSRKVREAGWWGFTAPAEPEGKGHGLFVDRGALVGHLTQYSRGADDLLSYFDQWAWNHQQEAAQDDQLPAAVPDLVAQIEERRNGEAPEWLKTRLPGEVEGVPV